MRYIVFCLIFETFVSFAAAESLDVLGFWPLTRSTSLDDTSDYQNAFSGSRCNTYADKGPGLSALPLTSYYFDAGGNCQLDVTIHNGPVRTVGFYLMTMEEISPGSEYNLVTIGRILDFVIGLRHENTATIFAKGLGYAERNWDRYKWKFVIITVEGNKMATYIDGIKETSSAYFNNMGSETLDITIGNSNSSGVEFALSCFTLLNKTISSEVEAKLLQLHCGLASVTIEYTKVPYAQGLLEQYSYRAFSLSSLYLPLFEKWSYLGLATINSNGFAVTLTPGVNDGEGGSIWDLQTNLPLNYMFRQTIELHGEYEKSRFYIVYIAKNIAKTFHNSGVSPMKWKGFVGFAVIIDFPSKVAKLIASPDEQSSASWSDSVIMDVGESFDFDLNVADFLPDKIVVDNEKGWITVHLATNKLQTVVIPRTLLQTYALIVEANISQAITVIGAMVPESVSQPVKPIGLVGLTTYKLIEKVYKIIVTPNVLGFWPLNQITKSSDVSVYKNDFDEKMCSLYNGNGPGLFPSSRSSYLFDHGDSCQLNVQISANSISTVAFYLMTLDEVPIGSEITFIYITGALTLDLGVRHNKQEYVFAAGEQGLAERLWETRNTWQFFIVTIDNFQVSTYLDGKKKMSQVPLSINKEYDVVNITIGDINGNIVRFAINCYTVMNWPIKEKLIALYVQESCDIFLSNKPNIQPPIKESAVSFKDETMSQLYLPVYGKWSYLGLGTIHYKKASISFTPGHNDGKGGSIWDMNNPIPLNKPFRQVIKLFGSYKNSRFYIAYISNGISQSHYQSGIAPMKWENFIGSAIIIDFPTKVARLIASDTEEMSSNWTVNNIMEKGVQFSFEMLPSTSNLDAIVVDIEKGWISAYLATTTNSKVVIPKTEDLAAVKLSQNNVKAVTVLGALVPDTVPLFSYSIGVVGLTSYNLTELETTSFAPTITTSTPVTFASTTTSVTTALSSMSPTVRPSSVDSRTTTMKDTEGNFLIEYWLNGTFIYDDNVTLPNGAIIKVEGELDTNLENPKSVTYKQLSESMDGPIRSLYAQFDVVNLTITGFYRGSIVTSYVTVLRSLSDLTEEEIQNRVKQRKQDILNGKIKVVSAVNNWSAVTKHNTQLNDKIYLKSKTTSKGTSCSLHYQSNILLSQLVLTTIFGKMLAII